MAYEQNSPDKFLNISIPMYGQLAYILSIASLPAIFLIPGLGWIVWILALTCSIIGIKFGAGKLAKSALIITIVALFVTIIIGYAFMYYFTKSISTPQRVTIDLPF